MLDLRLRIDGFMAINTQPETSIRHGCGNVSLELGAAIRIEALFMRMIPTLLDREGIERDVDQVVEVRPAIGFAPPTARRGASAGDDEAMPIGDDLNRLNVRDVQVSTKNEIYLHPRYDIERLARVARYAVTSERLNPRQMVMHDEHFEHLPALSAKVLADGLPFTTSDVPPLYRSAIRRINT